MFLIWTSDATGHDDDKGEAPRLDVGKRRCGRGREGLQAATSSWRTTVETLSSSVICPSWPRRKCWKNLTIRPPSLFESLDTDQAIIFHPASTRHRTTTRRSGSMDRSENSRENWSIKRHFRVIKRHFMSITPCLAKLSPCLASITQCLAKLSPYLASITQCLAELSPCLAVINRDFSRVRALTVRFHGSLSQKILKNAGLSRYFY